MPIIIIIWHYNPLWAFTFSVRSLQVLLSLAVSFQFFIFSFFKSSMMSSCHCCLGLPTGLFPIGFQSNSFLVGLTWSILCIWPSHLVLCALMNLTISALSINLSFSMLFHILHILSILTGPNIFLCICLSKMCRLFSSFAVKVQVSDVYVTTGLIIVLYIFILVFFFRRNMPITAQIFMKFTIAQPHYVEDFCTECHLHLSSNVKMAGRYSFAS